MLGVGELRVQTMWYQSPMTNVRTLTRIIVIGMAKATAQNFVKTMF